MSQGGDLVLATTNADRVEGGAPHEEGEIAGEFVMVSVSDTGAGMSPEVLARAFDPFFTTKPIGHGTGLGLSMIYGFTTQSGGHIRLASALGRGTTVKLYLPRIQAIAAESVGADAPVEVPLGRGETVLLVEDEPAVRLLVAELLADFGYRTIQAEDSVGALAILESSSPVDLMVTDVGLPGMDGRQLAEVGRGLRPGLKVLLMTGYTEKAALRSEFLGEKMHLIAKPFTPDALGRQIQETLRS
jgi:CheY-like chemotaxis protein